MSTPVSPRRKWLQVHLSTAVILMFVAGGLIWANQEGQFGPLSQDIRRCTPELGDLGGSRAQDFLSVTGHEIIKEERFGYYGWPRTALRSTATVIVYNDRANPNRDHGIYSIRDATYLSGPIHDWLVEGLLIDAFVALSILFTVWFVCESWIAWRTGRKKG